MISEIVCNEARELLQDRTSSLVQISDHLRFSNPSHFGKFFKRQTGMSPKRYGDLIELH